MHRLSFINQTELSRLKEIITITLNEWMDAWVLNKNCALKVEPISYKNFSNRSMCSLVSESTGLPILFEDDNFSWEQFVFANISGQHSENANFKDLMAKIKSDFVNSIFNQKNAYSERRSYLPKTVDAYFLVLIGSNEIGFMEFIAPHSYFSSILGKIVNNKSSKLDGNKFGAISRLKIPIDFKIKFSGVSFVDLINIKQGSILRSDINVENNFSLCIENNEVAYVSVGKRQSSKAYLIKGKKNG